MDHGMRRDRLAQRFDGFGVDAVVVTRAPNVRYLTGFTGSNGQALIGSGGGTFFTDGRYTDQSAREVPDLGRVTYAPTFFPSLQEACLASGVRRLGFESGHVTVRSHGLMAAALDGVTLVPLDGEVEQLRWTKDDEELRLLDRAQEATDRAFEDIVEKLAVGLTERQVAQDMEHAMRRAGADGPAFDTIVAFGENAAEPHHEPNHRMLEEGDIVKIDAGARWGGYHADMTRTVSFGSLTGELRHVYEVVLQAQSAGIAAVHAGATGAQVDAAARTVVSDAGYGERFTHSLGHGVGLEVHEGPGLRRDGTDVLPEGAIVTVEPGIYLPGIGGVRIEDSVEVTGEGCRVLPGSPRELIEL